jgi:RNA polymerase sigma-70 factor (ECF subfamily)
MERRSTNLGRERERDLVLAFQSGNAAAYDSIDRSCRPAAERICRRLLVNPADVEEAVQETMVRAYQGLPRFNGSYALTAWIARIATNVCLDTLRARARRPQNVGAIEPGMETPNGHETEDQHEDPEELVVKVFESEEVHHVLAELPERHRTALVLREFEGYSHRRIAEMLDTSPQRVKALIHRAKAGFRRAWKDDGPGRIAAFAPLLTPVNWVRKLFGRAPEFDHTVSSSVANAAASPVTQSVVGVASERISTAIAAVMLAGTVGLAVQNAPKPTRAQEEAPPAVVQLVQAPPAPVAEEKPPREHHKRDRVKEEAPTLPAVAPSPEAEVNEEVVLEAPDDPKGAQQPSVAPSPALPPHPAGFAFSFTSDRPSSSPCGCGSGPALDQDQVTASEAELTAFSEKITGAAIRDASGQNAWPVEITQSGNQYTHRMTFTVTTADGASYFDAQGGAIATSTENWGGWTITYHGSYQRRGGPREHIEAPQRGSYDAVLTFSWRQSRLVEALIQLSETT